MRAGRIVEENAPRAPDSWLAASKGIQPAPQGAPIRPVPAQGQELEIDFKAIVAVLTLAGAMAAFAYKDPKGHERIVAPKLSKLVGIIWVAAVGATMMGWYSSRVLTPFLDPNKLKLAEQAKNDLASIPTWMLGVGVLAAGFSMFLDVVAYQSQQMDRDNKSVEKD